MPIKHLRETGNMNDDNLKAFIDASRRYLSVPDGRCTL